MDKVLIEYHKVSLTFGRLTLFQDFNLQIPAGGKIVLKGKSGIGKSSLFHLLLGFLVPTDGEVRYDGQPVLAGNIWDVRRRIRYVAQESLPGRGKVSAILAEYARFKSNRHFQDYQLRLAELLDYFELKTGLLESHFEELSGGEKQRFSIILASLFPGETYLLDEATSALDDKLKDKTIHHFFGMPQVTVLAISHDAHWLQSESRIFNLESGAWLQ